MNAQEQAAEAARNDAEQAEDPWAWEGESQAPDDDPALAAAPVDPEQHVSCAGCETVQPREGAVFSPDAGDWYCAGCLERWEAEDRRAAHEAADAEMNRDSEEADAATWPGVAYTGSILPGDSLRAAADADVAANLADLADLREDIRAESELDGHWSPSYAAGPDAPGDYLADGEATPVCGSCGCGPCACDEMEADWDAKVAQAEEDLDAGWDPFSQDYSPAEASLADVFGLSVDEVKDRVRSFSDLDVEARGSGPAFPY